MSSIQQILKDARATMDKDLAHVKHEFGSVRSGKASPSMLDTVKVDMYGQSMQLNQVATINAPEPRAIIVTPFDKGQIKVVHKYAEDGRVAVRHARTQGRDTLKKLAGVSEDDVKHAEKDLQKLHDDYIHKIDELIKAKEAEIMEV